MNVFDVPFISQIEPDGNGRNNCGPACVAMALAYVGVIEPTRDAMHQVADVLRDGVADGNWALGTYTTIDQAYWYARNLGADVAKIGTWPAIWAELDAGNPVMLLVDNRLLQPRQYDRGPAFDAHHFILLTGFDGQQYRVNDPLAVYERAPGWYTAASVDAAVQSIGYVSALTIRQRVPAAPAIVTPIEESSVSEEDQAIVAACHARGLHDGQAVHDLCDWSGQIWVDNQALAAQIASQAADVQALSARIAAAPPAVVRVLAPAGVTVEVEPAA